MQFSSESIDEDAAIRLLRAVRNQSGGKRIKSGHDKAAPCFRCFENYHRSSSDSRLPPLLKRNLRLRIVHEGSSGDGERESLSSESQARRKESLLE